MLTSCSDSDFEYLNISFNESKLDGVGLNSDSLGHCIRKKGGKNCSFHKTVLSKEASINTLEKTNYIHKTKDKRNVDIHRNTKSTLQL